MFLLTTILNESRLATVPGPSDPKRTRYLPSGRLSILHSPRALVVAETLTRLPIPCTVTPTPLTPVASGFAESVNTAPPIVNRFSVSLPRSGPSSADRPSGHCPHVPLRNTFSTKHSTSKTIEAMPSQLQSAGHTRSSPDSPTQSPL